MINAELKKSNGAMTLFLNGNPVPFTTYKPTELNDDQLFEKTVNRSLKDISLRGVHVHFVPIYFDWPREGQYDFTKMDWRINKVLEIDPRANIVIRIQAESMVPKWWMDANPEGICSCGTGRKPELPPVSYSTPKSPSLASGFWKDAGIKSLQAMAEHVKQQDYAGKIIGYLPTSYNTNEWFFRTYHNLRVTDLCPDMQKAFTLYLHEKKGVKDEFKVPDRIERDYGDYGYFFHPDPLQSNFPVVEYYRFVNTLCAQAIVDITKALKAVHLPQKIIVGTFYGYAQGLANFYWLADSGHLDLKRLLEDDGPDFTCSPLEYFTRNFYDPQNGGFCWSQSTAPDSGLIANKGYFGEDDFAPPTTKPIGWSSAANDEQDAELLKRNFVFTLCKGQLMWWYDLHGHWYESKERLGMIEDCVRIAKEAIQVDRSQLSEVAVIMDEQASWYVTMDRQFQRAMFWENFYHSFSKAGTTVDLLLLSDILKTDMKKYKIVFLPTCFSLTTEQRKAIDQLKSEGRTLVFYQADGLIWPDNEEGPVLSDSNIQSLTEINIVETKNLFQLKITADDKHELTDGCENMCFGVETEKEINFIVEDEASETLGYFSGRGPSGFAVKRFKNWKSVYCGVPGMPYQLVRNLLKDAGVHIYCEDHDVIYANKSYVGVFVTDGQVKQIKLPGHYKVRECFSGSVFSATPINEINFNAKLYHTYLFELR